MELARVGASLIKFLSHTGSKSLIHDRILPNVLYMSLSVSMAALEM